MVKKIMIHAKSNILNVFTHEKEEACNVSVVEKELGFRNLYLPCVPAATAQIQASVCRCCHQLCTWVLV